MEPIKEDGGPPVNKEGGGKQQGPGLLKNQKQQQKQNKTLKRLKSQQQKKLRLVDSFADSLDRPSSSSSSDDDDDEEEEETTPHEQQPSLIATASSTTPQKKRKRKHKRLLRIPVTRILTCPDMVRVDRCHRLPEYGPRILFFSGGSALRDLSGILKYYTHNSIHLITPFDSGGSSAEIRKAFAISAVGDLRNRLVALSDESALGNPEVINFLTFRLDKEDADLGCQEFESILQGQHPLAKAMKMPMRSLLLRHLKWFSHRMPSDFNLCGASIGNLIITGCWLEHDKDIVAALYLLWNLLGVKGQVRPITGAHLHLRTLYHDGVEQVGQHLMGKRKPSPQKIQTIDLVKFLEDDESSSSKTTGDSSTRQKSQVCHLDFVSSELIASCNLLVFPMGSFFGSVLANLLPVGVGKAIKKCDSPKIYVPNTGMDPEMHGYTLSELIMCIVQMVENDLKRGLLEDDDDDDDENDEMTRKRILDEAKVNPADIVNFVLVDTENCDYCVPIDKEKIQAMGIVIMDIPLVAVGSASSLPGEDATNRKSAFLDPTKLAEVLITLGS